MRRTLALLVVVVGLSASVVVADEWLVYIGGGLEPIEGGWTERQNRVLFTNVGGTLMSVSYEDVDLPASTFITWQLGGRRQVPPRASFEELPPSSEAVSPPPCEDARLIRLFSPESLEVATGEEREIVHVACLDTPESNHLFPALGWFGRAAMSAVETAVREGARVCLTEETPPRRDGKGHRVVYVSLEDGRDFATLVVASGFGLLRPSECRRGAHYRSAEDQAISRQVGLWGRSGAPPAFDAARLGAASVPPGSRGASGGCRLRR